MKKFELNFYPFDKEIVELYEALCKEEGWKNVNRMHSLYFCYPNVTSCGDSVWFITNNNLNASIKNCNSCSYCIVENNVIKEYFIEKFSTAMDDRSRRVVFVKTQNGFENYGLFELINCDFEFVSDIEREIFVKTYKLVSYEN